MSYLRVPHQITVQARRRDRPTLAVRCQWHAAAQLPQTSHWCLLQRNLRGKGGEPKGDGTDPHEDLAPLVDSIHAADPCDTYSDPTG